jgi:hypothetical protein
VITNNSISFADLSRREQAGHPLRITQWPANSGAFFVLQCEAHPEVEFTMRDPISRAAHHLRTCHEDEPGLDTSHAGTLRRLGVAVLGCNALKAATNNGVFKAGGGSGCQPHGLPSIDIGHALIQPETPNAAARAIDADQLGSATGAPSLLKTTPVPSEQESPCSPLSCLMSYEPSVGEVCKVWWSETMAKPSTEAWYLAVRLPLGDMAEISLDGTLLSDTNLLSHPFEKVPACYVYSPESSDPLAWAPGADSDEVAEQRIEREYPMLFFEDDLLFPEDGPISLISCTKGHPVISWVPRQNLRMLDDESDGLPPADSLPAYGVAMAFEQRLRTMRHRAIEIASRKASCFLVIVLDFPIAGSIICCAASLRTGC